MEVKYEYKDGNYVVRTSIQELISGFRTYEEALEDACLRGLNMIK